MAVGAALGVEPLNFVLTGGDDHPLVGTFPSSAAVPDGWQVIGAVHELGGDGVAQVTVDGAPYDGPQGYRHF